MLMSLRMTKFVGVVVIVCCYLELVKGSCLSYGHSCWGAHGKRGNQPAKMLPPKTEQQLAERWALIKVMPQQQKHYNLPDILNSEERGKLNRIRKIGGKSMEQLLENSEEIVAQPAANDNKNFGSRQIQQLKKQILTNPTENEESESENLLEDEFNAQNEWENDANLEARNMRIIKLMRNSSPSFTA